MTPEEAEEFHKRNPSWPHQYLGRPDLGFGIGESTDDGELTLCLLESIYGEDNRMVFHPDVFMSRLIEWKESNPKDIGNTVNNAIRLLKKERKWYKAGRDLWLAGNSVASNGSLMRLSPVPALIGKDITCLITAILSSVPTHYDLEVFVCCCIFSLFCYELIHKYGPVGYSDIFSYYVNYGCIREYLKMGILMNEFRLHPEIQKMPEMCFCNNCFFSKDESPNIKEILNTIKKDFFSEDGSETHEKTFNDIYDRIANIENFNPKDIPISQMGKAINTLMVGLWAEKNSGSFEEGIQKVVRLGLDADTYGAVAGAILGAKYGFSAIPERYITPLWMKDKVNKALDKYGLS